MKILSQLLLLGACAISGIVIAGCDQQIDQQSQQNCPPKPLSQAEIQQKLPQMFKNIIPKKLDDEYFKADYNFEKERANFKPIGQVGKYILVHYRYEATQVPGSNVVFIFDRDCKRLNTINFTQFATDIKLMNNILTAVDKSGYTERYKISLDQIGKEHDELKHFYPRKKGKYIVLPVTEISSSLYLQEVAGALRYPSWAKAKFGYPFGVYVVVYGDGTTESELKKRFKSKPAGNYGIEYRFMHFSEFFAMLNKTMKKVCDSTLNKPAKDLERAHQPGLIRSIGFGNYENLLQIAKLVADNFWEEADLFYKPLITQLPVKANK